MIASKSHQQFILSRGVPVDLGTSWESSGGGVCRCSHGNGRKTGLPGRPWAIFIRLGKCQDGHTHARSNIWGAHKLLQWPSIKEGCVVPEGLFFEQKKPESPLHSRSTAVRSCRGARTCGRSIEIDACSSSGPSSFPSLRAKCWSNQLGNQAGEEDNPAQIDLDVDDEYGEDLPVDELNLEARFAVNQHELNILLSLEQDEDQSGNSQSGRKGAGKKRSQQQDVGMQIPEHLLPHVAIVGRPNVGKSALFNRIVGGNQAIVHNEPGVTRDRLYRRAFWGSHEFLVIDTGGIINTEAVEEGVAVGSKGGDDALATAVRDASRSGLPSMIEKHAAMAVEQAVAVIMVVDGQTGLVGSDIEIAAWLRRKHPDKHVTLAVNKCESPTKGLLQCAEFWSLGFTPFPVSAITGSGTGDFLDDLCQGLNQQIMAASDKEFLMESEENQPLGIAIVGRPNVGKSSIMNAILGEERTIVSPMSGTTRDAIDMDFTATDGKLFRLIDTAGIRRRAAVAAAKSRAESLSIQRAFRAVRRADVVALIVDAKEGVTEQDGRLADRIEKEGKACVIVMNKWDTVPDKDSNTMNRYTEAIRLRLAQLDWAPIVYTSATSNQRIQRILEAAEQVGAERCKRLPTATLNAITQEAYAFKQPPAMSGKKGRIYYCTQAAIRPPTFVFFVNDAQLFPEAYRRFMEKQLRANVGYQGTPLRLLWRSKRRDPDRNVAKQHAAVRS